MSRVGCFLALALLSLAAAFGQSAPPAITVQPASTTANAGQSVTLSLTATGSPTPTIQWFKDGKAVSGATNSSLTFASVFGGDAGTYTATVSNVYNGSTYTLTTTPAVLTVITTPPTIITHPVSQTVTAGGNVTLTIAASGSEPMLYRWYRDGVEVSGAAGPSLTIAGVKVSDVGNYTALLLNWANQIKAVSAMGTHCMFLKSDGSLWGMGANQFGQLGDGTTTDRITPVQVASGIADFSAGFTHTMLLKSDGSLWGVGSNQYGNLGDGTTTNRVYPVQVASGVVSVTAGYRHSMFVKRDGTLWAMGQNSNGQLGDGTTTDRISPVQVASGVASASAGSLHTVFVKSDGTLWGMGNTQYGRIGEGTLTSVNLSTPVQVASGVTGLSAGPYHTMFVKADGTLWGMGSNTYGRLGDGTQSNRSTPVRIANGVASVSAGQLHTMFVKSDGSLWGMGYNANGRLGDSTTTDRITPVQVASGVANVSAGYSQSMFLKSDGTLWGMGYNGDGRLGDGTKTDRIFPVRSAGGFPSNVATLTVNVLPAITTQPANQTVLQGASATFSVVATGTPSPTYQWYVNGTSAISGATNASYSIPNAQLANQGPYTVKVTNAAGEVTSSIATLTVNVLPAITTQPESRRVVALGGTVSLTASVTGATSYQWRRNGVELNGATSSSLTISNARRGVDDGWYQLIASNASGPTVSRAAWVVVSVPGKVVTWGATAAGQNSVPADLTSATAIACGRDFVLALRADGSVVAWGDNSQGQCNVPSGLADVVGVAAGATHALALRSDGTIVGWGLNASGQVTIPAGLKDVVGIGGGADFSVALKADGTVAAWGAGYFGQTTPPATLSGAIGVAVGFHHVAAWKADGTIFSWGNVAAAPSSLSNTRFIAVGNDHCSALNASGTVVAWGDNALGQTNVPEGLSGVQMLAGGFYHNLALKTDGSVAAWGYNLAGQINVPQNLGTVLQLSGGYMHSAALVQLPPAIILQPFDVVIPTGERTQLKVNATGAGTLTYQWYQGQSGATTSPVTGATSPTFTTPTLTATTSYWVRITDGNGAVVNSPTVTVTVSATSPLTVTQQIVGSGYSAGGGVIVTNTITYSGTAPSRIDWATLLPAGWKYLGSGGSEGVARPPYESGDLLEWSWTTVPASPIKFTYTVGVPAGTTGDQVIASLVSSQAAGTSYQTMAKPDPLVIRSASLHTADSNRDGKISLTELTRVIELYNYRSGTTRTGQYKPQAGTEDGFAPGP